MLINEVQLFENHFDTDAKELLLGIDFLDPVDSRLYPFDDLAKIYLRQAVTRSKVII